ncbi:MAG TPA: glycosyltransferase family 4 protein [Candidatus Sulfotelmatobacter sp.]|nr:glycosyltransferase family 4 protein [Candidatus Sulfotelmatobacter sp.]
MRILWVKAGKLLPVDTGGKIRSYNILRHLARNHEVTLLSYYGGQRDSSYESEIRHELPRAQTIYTASPDESVVVQTVHYVGRIFQPEPFAVSKFTHPAVQRAVSAWLNGKELDVAVCDFLSASLNFPETLATPTVLFQHNVESALWQRMASTESNPAKRLAYRLEAKKMLRYERSALRKFHHVIAVSEHDRKQMLAMDPDAGITVVPTGVDTQKYEIAPPSSTNLPRIVFTGSMDWEPNIDAVAYFCQQIFPGILAEFPSAVFQIVGRNPHSSVRKLASRSVEVTGTVPSVAAYLRDASVVVVPLRIGGGTRLKIFEAMAMGKALVSTSIGAEGLDVENGRDLVLADDAASQIQAITLLLRDSALRRQYEEAAARLAAQYDWSNIERRFAEVLQQVSRGFPTRRPYDLRIARQP